MNFGAPWVGDPRETENLALKENGTVWAWGDNEYGQIGNDSFGTDSDVPVVVRTLLDVKNIDGGYEFTLAAVR